MISISISRIIDIFNYGSQYRTTDLPLFCISLFGFASIISLYGIIRDIEKIRGSYKFYGIARFITLAYLFTLTIGQTSYGAIVVAVLSVLSLVTIRLWSEPFNAVETPPLKQVHVEPEYINTPKITPAVMQNKPKTKFCINCGTENPVFHQICQNCNKPISVLVDKEPKPEPPKPQIAFNTPPPPPPPRPVKTRICGKCGEENPPKFKFCENCGASLEEKPNTMKTIPPPPKPKTPADPLDPLMAGYTGRDQTWQIILGNDKEDMGSTKLWNLWDEGIIVPQATNKLLMDSIIKNEVQLALGIRRVILPNGQATTGGYMYSFAKFGKRAGQFSDKEVSVLFLGGETDHVRVCSANDKNLTETQLRSYIELLTTNPKAANELSIWLYNN